MNGKLLQGPVAIIFLLAACTPLVTTIPDVTLSASETPSPIPTYKSLPTETAAPTITPLPTIPTSTPTFDVSTINTVTPAVQADCPEEDSSLRPTFEFDRKEFELAGKILSYLNKGGSLEILLSMLPASSYGVSLIYEDLTGDKMPEFVYRHYSDDNNSGFYIFTCMAGSYELYKVEVPNWGFSLYGVYDMNLNGVPELVVISRGCSLTGCYRHYILEWNGSTYINLSPDATIESVIDGRIADINADDVLELVLITAPLPIFVDQPWREEIHVFLWNGSVFVPQTVKGFQPRYRFQAIQDADAEITLGGYDTALNLYRQAIFSDRLDWWSRDRHKYEQALVETRWTHEPTPSVKPQEDKTEYPRLAAYAYYRIMIMHLALGNRREADAIYRTLQQKFAENPYADPYTEMAIQFWESYQSTQNMYDSCAAAIQYAAQHPDILGPLGSDYHGSQSHTYVPADVCPFR